ncbi:hypothetical protein L211DRAFT_334490 [Terfezia boudieri ATCC MYA-4762]|uniref:Uncharacterized protein n=1 Tax=Terfezia boudieri ATCC MYA-4762 TaxID=1051890 RepID=A0A3N4LWD3_9PEZI|nr:hypothetical protein L211DRAFT_334490 [Terfezia boudieri ATCC MYA-4762]
MEQGRSQKRQRSVLQQTRHQFFTTGRVEASSDNQEASSGKQEPASDEEADETEAASDEAEDADGESQAISGQVSSAEEEDQVTDDPGGARCDESIVRVSSSEGRKTIEYGNTPQVSSSKGPNTIECGDILRVSSNKGRKTIEYGDIPRVSSSQGRKSLEYGARVIGQATLRDRVLILLSSLKPDNDVDIPLTATSDEIAMVLTAKHLWAPQLVALFQHYPVTCHHHPYLHHSGYPA